MIVLPIAEDALFLFAESSAFVWALQLAENTSMKKIIVEGDAIIDALLSSSNDFRDIAALINDALICVLLVPFLVVSLVRLSEMAILLLIC